MSVPRDPTVAPRSPVLRSWAGVIVAFAVLTGCETADPVAEPTANTPDTPAPSATPTPTLAFDATRLEDAGYVRNDEQSVGTREQYQDIRCVVQLIVLDEGAAADDATATELAFTALGEAFTDLEERPDVALPVEGGTLAMQARRTEVETGSEVVAMQVAMRALHDVGMTVAVTHGCYDHTVTDAEFDDVLALLSLTGVAPSGF